ncbi:MAG: CARDB domain-containing protein [Acidobacteriota bacterium]
MHHLLPSFRLVVVASLLAPLLALTPAFAGIGISELSITKTDGATVSTIGGSITYTIVGTNAGPDDIFNATVTDTFPADLTGCTWTCSASAGSSCSASGSGDLSDTVSLLENGTVTYTVNCSISASASPGTLSNTASITSAAVDTTPADDMATDTNSLWPAADLSITKTDGLTSAAPGDSLTYTIVASNGGPMASFGATVTDTFPSALTCTWTCSASPGSSCSASGTGNLSDSVSLLSGGTATYTANCAIALTATGTLSNTATISGMVVDSNASNDSATDSDTVLSPSTDLQVALADTPDPVVAGEDITYTATVTNNGPSNSTGGTLTSAVPAGTTFSSSADCTEAGGTITCAIGALAPAGSEMVSFVVSVDPARTAAVAASATIAANETDPTAANDTATASTAVSAETDLSIALADAPDPVTAGQDITYTATVTNNGPSSSTGGAVTATVPAGTAFSSSADCTEAGGTVTCAIGGLAPSGSDMVSFTVTVDPDRTTAIAASATVTANETDPTAANDTATASTVVSAETDLSIALADAPDPVVAGQDITYTATVTNNGPSTSTGGTVTAAVPAGAAFSSSADCTEAGGTVTCAIGGLAPSASDSVSFAVTVDPDRTTAIAASATVTANETDSTAANDTATASTAVDVETDLSIALADTPDPVVAGQDITYTATVTNNGPSSSTGSTVTATVPAGTTFSSSSDCAEAGGTVSCAIGGLAPSGSDTVSFVVTVDLGTSTISASASVAADETDPNAANDTATSSTTVDAETDVSIALADAPDPVVAGQDITYTATVTNNGPSASTGSTVTAAVPTGTTFSSSADCTEAGGTVTCAIGGLAPSASDSVSFSVTVDPSRTTAISASATVTANETDPDAGNDSASATTAVLTEADLSITKIDSADPVAPGAAFSYTLTVANAGPSDAVDVVATDTLPADVGLLSTSGCAEDPTGVPTCTLGTVAAGGTASFTINVTAPSTAGMVTNTASVSTTTTDTNAGNDSASETTTVTPSVLSADVSITKDNGVTVAVPGGSVTYTIIAANAGPDDAAGATVTDLFPAILDCAWTCVASGGSSCSAAGSGDIADTVTLLAGGSATYSAVCAIDSAATGSLVNTATISTPTGDPNPGNESATDTDTLEPSADLAASVVTMPDPVDFGEAVTLLVMIDNQGPSDADAVVVTTTLPSGLTLDGTVGCVEDPNGIPTCSLGSIVAGDVATFTIDATVTGESSTGSLLVESATPDPNGSNDAATPQVTVAATIVEVPVLDTWGLLILMLLLSGAGIVALRRS